jgi:ABC-2 type transport system ATP-binding protein
MDTILETDQILQIENVGKSYGRKPALTGLSFTIGPNQIVGLLGPNGSGKTTLLKLVNTLITDYSGKIRVCGHPPGLESKKLVSYLPDKPFLRADLKIRTAVDMYKDFYEDFDRNKALEMLKTMRLEPDMRIQTLSKGMREKFQLALVMSRAARLYVFDEPIAGVDPAARDVILETIIKNFVDGASLLISTHLISDVENILDRVLFIREGRIVLDENADKLREEHGKSIDQIFREGFRC